MVPLKEGYSTVIRRVLPDLNQGTFPSRPIVPFMQVIHNRLNIEVARGCTRGCRFCQAGMIYRPLRERSPRKIVQLVETGLEHTGYEEVSLLSLSTGDYSCLEPLVDSILQQSREKRVAISLPSLRVETLTPSLIRQILEARKTGFTLAPEAGTERLRQVINKGNTEEDLLATIHRVFSAGWRLVKLYFMIGLPTEEEEDLRGIVSLCQKALRIARRANGSAQINVSISTFVPKAHTPFQWEPQCPGEEVQKKQQFLRRSLERNGLRVKWADPRLSLLEGVFARGDRRLGRVLEIAQGLGCRLDGWREHLRYDLWERAFSEAGLDPNYYLRQRAPDEPLPWDHLESRVTKYFLQEERRRALERVQTPDCRNASCNGCGVCYVVPGIQNRISDPAEVPDQKSYPPKKAGGISYPSRRFRSQFAKFGPAKFLGHLEFSQSIIRAFRRAQVPLVYSQGFHPLPKVSFGPPLPVGHESWAEFLDFFLEGTLQPEEATARLNAALPCGVTILGTREIPLKSPSIFDSIITILYSIKLSESGRLERDKVNRFLADPLYPVFWRKKKKDIDLKRFVESFVVADECTVKLGMHVTQDGTLRPEEALDLIFGWAEGERPPVSVQKIQVRFKD
jgi:radical SAM-linked protein